ncbi:hypothetical protein PsYK624_048240 [Phanerochaete sordida]|uniref:Uncharacterized protein n=1 Tax=Phanerochaete sordida TaxID=48140 RepID=A0A9P3G5R6_9APHY|nr:hypothetical protein PsYK624_048240 [Phanerochaete sordida]
MSAYTHPHHKTTAPQYDEAVEVRIEGNLWAAGVIVAVMEIVNKFVAVRYEVLYRLRDGRVVGLFDADRVRPARRAPTLGPEP